MRHQTPAAGFIVPGAAAGLAGAALICAYLLTSLVAVRHETTVAQFFQFLARAAAGPAAPDGTAGTLLGVILHVAVSLAWGLGYAYVALRLPQVLGRPLLSGIVFGLVVMLAMQLAEVAANVYRLPDTASLANNLVAHLFFFGLPVAYVTRTLAARTS